MGAFGVVVSAVGSVVVAAEVEVDEGRMKEVV